MKKDTFIQAATVALLATLTTTSASAAFMFDEDVTSNNIFGSGNDNGSFTIDRNNGIELGLRGKLRFDVNNLPQNQFNSNGDGTYTFDAGVAPGGFGFAPNSPTTPVWNFEWSINSNFDGTSGVNLDALTYEIGIDFDPSAGTNFLTFDPINVIIADHSIGTNATAQSAGVEASGVVDYANLIANNNLAQNSWNMEFFNDGPFSGFDPNAPGTYSFYISASDATGELARVEADIIVTPEPGSAALLGIAILGVMSRRRRS